MAGYEYARIPEKGEQITGPQDDLTVPSRPIIPYIEGDGTGPDIWRATRRVLDAAVLKAYDGEREIAWMEIFAGEKAHEKTGEWLPDESLRALREFKVGIKGPLSTPVGGGIRSLNVTLRQVLDLYSCIRPVRYFEGVGNPMKHPEKLNVVIFRENTEDVYAGIEWKAGSPEARKLRDYIKTELGKDVREGSALGIKPMSEFGSKRLVEMACRYALERNLPSVTLVHKGNIMKFTEGAFRDWGYEIAEAEFGDKVFTWAEYDRIVEKDGKDAANKAQEEAEKAGKIIVKDAIADIFLQLILTRPTEHSVVVTMNLNGDYISDALAAQVGGIGIAPGANINYKTSHAIFEATHGTAPKYAGLDKVNPASVILSGVLML